MADIPGGTTTTATFDGDPLTGASISGEFESFFDTDWIKVSLTAGETYSIYAHDIEPGQDYGDTYLQLFDATGLELDYSFDGELSFTATTSATFFIGISDYSGLPGHYTVDVTATPATEVFLSFDDDFYSGQVGERILGGPGDDEIDIGAGLDALGEQGNDDLTGNDLANFISGGLGNDYIDGLEGDDSLFGGDGGDVIYGYTGDDRIFGGDGGDMLYGEAGNNQIHGGAGADLIIGDVDNDLLWGDAGDDLIIGDGGADRLDGGDGDDILIGDDGSGLPAGNDVMRGRSGDDIIAGGRGNDQLLGDAGADDMTGGDGNDAYHVDNAGDTVDETGTTGTDRVYSSISFDLTDIVHVFGDVENLVLTGTANVDGTGSALANALAGNSGDNVLSGLDGNDRLDGRAGNDQFAGGADNDTLLGWAGQDILTGGAGGDRLIGGLDADSFVFTSTAESDVSGPGRDVILDFSAAEGDKIDLSAIDADSVTGGVQDFSFIGTAAFTHQAGELRYLAQNGSVFVYADTDGDGAADFSILAKHLSSIQATDFLL